MSLNDWVEIAGVTMTAIIVVVCVWLIIEQFWGRD